jgi:hypothetical protein
LEFPSSLGLRVGMGISRIIRAVVKEVVVMEVMGTVVKEVMVVKEVTGESNIESLFMNRLTFSEGIQRQATKALAPPHTACLSQLLHHSP